MRNNKTGILKNSMYLNNMILQAQCLNELPVNFQEGYVFGFTNNCPRTIYENNYCSLNRVACCFCKYKYSYYLLTYFKNNISELFHDLLSDVLRFKITEPRRSRSCCTDFRVGLSIWIGIYCWSYWCSGSLSNRLSQNPNAESKNRIIYWRAYVQKQY